MRKVVPFTDLLSTIVDNRGRTCPTAESGTPLIATNCIRNDLLYPAFENIRYVSQQTYDNWFRGHPRPGDIIFVCKGSPGRVCLAPDPVGFCIAQDMVAVRANAARVYPRFLFALLRSHHVQEQIANMHVGTLIPHFKKGDFDKLLLELPDEATQRFVGDTYFDLSLKIELNRRMNETLEAMARALFKSWFVDFDPVRAKAEGRQPSGMDAATAKLFPSELVESDVGPIPRGWRVAPLDAIASFRNGLALQNFRPSDGEACLPVVKIAQLRTGNADSKEWAKASIDPACIIDDGDMIFSWSGSLTVVVWSGGRAALNQHLFRVTSGVLPAWLVYQWLLQHLPEFQSIASDKATTMGHIQRYHLTAALCVVPPNDICNRLSELADPLFKRALESTLESRALAELRDALLPRLLSGELRVRDAERIASVAT